MSGKKMNFFQALLVFWFALYSSTALALISSPSPSPSPTQTPGNGGIVPAGGIPANCHLPSTPTAVVANSADDTVSIINLSQLNDQTLVGVGDYPLAVVLTPAGCAYIANSNSNNVSVVDLSSRTVIATVTVGQGPWGIARSPDGQKVYVTNFYGQSLSVIDTASNTLTATIPLTNGPSAVTTAPNGTILVANYYGSSVTTINPQTNALTTMAAGPNPSAIAVKRDGSRYYVANYASNNVMVFDAQNNNNLLATIPVGNSPTGLTLNADGSRLFVANFGSGNLSEIDTSNNQANANNIAVGNYPVGLAFNPATGRLHVTLDGDGKMGIVDVAQRNVTDRLNVGQAPQGIGIWAPDTTPPSPLIVTASVAQRLNSVRLTWTGGDDAQSDVRYSIRRCTYNQLPPFQLDFGTCIYPTIPPLTVKQYDDTTVIPGSRYSYQVTAWSLGGQVYTDLDVSTQDPTPPTALVVTATIAQRLDKVTLTWTGGDDAQSDVRYSIRRCTYNQLPPFQLDFGTCIYPTIPPLTVKQYDDTTVIPGSRYSYQVTAWSLGGQVYTDLDVSTQDPTPPTALSVTASVAQRLNSVRLTWTGGDDAQSDVRYSIRRCTYNQLPPFQLDFGTCIYPTIPPLTVKQYDDTTVIPGSRYSYQVTAWSLGGQVYTDLDVSTQDPTPPTALVVTATIAQRLDKVTLTWTGGDDAQSDVRYSIRRCTYNQLPPFQLDFGTCIYPTIPPLTVKQYDDTTVIPGSRYSYQVTAWSLGGQVYTDLDVSTQDPTPPTALVVTATIAQRLDKVTLTWTGGDDAQSDVRYSIRRCTYNQLPPFQLDFGTCIYPTIPPLTVKQYDDTTVIPGSRYSYQVTAWSLGGQVYTDLDVSTQDPTPPTALSVTASVAQRLNSVRLTWTGGDDAQSDVRYSIRRCTYNQLPPFQLDFGTCIYPTIPPLTVKQYDDTTVIPGSRYSYQVTAWSLGGQVYTDLDVSVPAAAPAAAPAAQKKVVLNKQVLR